MKFDKHYQVATIQHTMRCLRGAIDTVWDAFVGGVDFPEKKDWSADIDALRTKIKELEQRACEAAIRTRMSR